MDVIHAKIVKETFEKYEKASIPTATLVLGDQSPGDSLKSYWMTFLHQETAVLFGAEQLARLLEQRIQQEPHYWLWSHKRWKRTIPENLTSLKEQQREKFNQYFRSDHQ